MNNHTLLSHFAISLVFLSASIFSSEKEVAMRYVIEKADRSHCLDEAAYVINSAYTKAMWLKKEVQRTSVQKLQEIIEQTDKKLYLCVDDKKICGSVLLDLASDQPEMAMLAVHPNYQGKNIGELLMQHVEQAVISHHYKSLFIYVIPFGQERLIAYYQRHGYAFIETSLTPFPHLELIQEPYRDKIFLRRMGKNLG